MLNLDSKTLIYFEDGMLIMFRTKPKEFGVLTNCASVKVGFFFLQICGIENLVKFPAQLVKFTLK
jgi:hypothetical protein